MNTKPDTHYSFRAPAREIDFARILREVPASTDVVLVKVEGAERFVTFARIGGDYDISFAGGYWGAYPQLEVERDGHLHFSISGGGKQQEWKYDWLDPEEVQALFRKVEKVRAARASARRVVVTGWE